MKKSVLILITLIMLLSSPAYALGQTVYVEVNGLVCDFCARTLEKVFGKQEPVENIDVNLDTKIITINFKEGQNLTDEIIKQLINDAGYSVTNIRHTEEQPKHEQKL